MTTPTITEVPESDIRHGVDTARRILAVTTDPYAEPTGRVLAWRAKVLAPKEAA